MKIARMKYWTREEATCADNGTIFDATRTMGGDINHEDIHSLLDPCLAAGFRDPPNEEVILEVGPHIWDSFDLAADDHAWGFLITMLMYVRALTNHERYEEALSRALEIVDIARQSGSFALEIDCLEEAGDILEMFGDGEGASRLFYEALGLATDFHHSVIDDSDLEERLSTQIEGLGEKARTARFEFLDDILEEKEESK